MSLNIKHAYAAITTAFSTTSSTFVNVNTAGAGTPLQLTFAKAADTLLHLTGWGECNAATVADNDQIALFDGTTNWAIGGNRANTNTNGLTVIGGSRVISLAAGTYTFTFRFKSAGGNNQTFPLGTSIWMKVLEVAP